MPPTLGNGKICYLEIPATDIGRSAAFYKAVFGWQIRTNNEGHAAFDDGVGEVSGTWTRGLPPHSKPGIVIHIMVKDAAATLEKIVQNGGEIVQSIGADLPEVTAKFRDPAGNVLGVYQERSLGQGD